MKITDEGLLFSDLASLWSFHEELQLSGMLKFNRPIQDNQGMILIKENVAVKDSFFERLQEMSGQYKADFSVMIDNDLLKRMSESLVNRILKHSEAAENSFIKMMIDVEYHRPKAYLLSAFRNRKFILSMYRFRIKRPDAFLFSAMIGLLTLGVVLPRYSKIKNLHRYSFLAGMLCDIARAESNQHTELIEDLPTKQVFARESAKIAEKMGVRVEVCDAIRDHPALYPIPGSQSAFKETKIGHDSADEAEATGGSVFEDFDEEIEEAEDQSPRDDMLASVLTEALRLGRFISDARLRLTDSSNFAEELVYRISYNSSRGIFHEDLIKPIMSRFKEFEHEARRLAWIGDIENQCLHKPSAWAYPKPRATQILCKDDVVDCPFLVQGWDIHVIATQDAYGWIGKPLPKGTYHKCGLEDKMTAALEKLDKNHRISFNRGPKSTSQKEKNEKKEDPPAEASGESGSKA